MGAEEFPSAMLSRLNILKHELRLDMVWSSRFSDNYMVPQVPGSNLGTTIPETLLHSDAQKAFSDLLRAELQTELTQLIL